MKSSTVVVRTPDETGKLVTYMTQLDVARAIGMNNSVISAWSKAGIVRKLNKRAGRGCHVALVDVLRIKLMSRTELIDAGIVKTPADYRRRNEEWRRKIQDKTRTLADHHYEDWDEYDCIQLCDLLQAGWPREVIATKLGRTYESVTTRIEQLRREGELPKIEHPNGDVTGLLALLTDDERKEVGV